MPRLKRANRGKRAAWPGLETDLLGWITEKRNNGLAILPSLVPKVANRHGVVIAAQEKGWMDTEGMKTWVQKVWCAPRGGLGRRRSLLVYDAFEAHVTESVKAAYELGSNSRWINVNFAAIRCCLKQTF